MLSMHDIININKQTRLGELSNFLMVMEVYGHAQENNFSAGLWDSRNESKSMDNG